MPSHFVLDRRVTIFCDFLLVDSGGDRRWALMDPSGVSSIAPLIAAVGIIIGVPHGAVDHLVPGWASVRWATPARLAFVVGVYVMVAIFAAMALLRTPDVSFAVFLLVSALHFGWAEVTYAAERDGDPGPRWPARG